MVLIFTVYGADSQYACSSFRPLAGIMVLITYTNSEGRSKRRRRFRPLAGIMVLIVTCEGGDNMTDEESFRPLAGIMVLITAIFIQSLISIYFVSVPLRGLWFLSVNRLAISLRPTPCFRPLAGIMVLIF